MAIKLITTKKYNLQNPGNSVVYHPKVIKTNIVDLDQISDEIAYATSLTRADCYAAVISLTERMAEHLSNGSKIQLGDLGTFQVQITCTAVATPEEVNDKLIRHRSVRFTPGKRFNKMLQSLRFTFK